MNAAGHAALAAVAWPATTVVLHRPGYERWAGLLLAVGCSMAPDVDNARWFRKLDRWLPDEALGFGGPLQHRGITHWWAWPAMLALLALALPEPQRWPLLAVAVGWGSHLVGDLAFGIRPPGIPILPWWGHVGLRLDSGGTLERWIATPALAIAAVVLLVAPGLVPRLWEAWRAGS